MTAGKPAYRMTIVDALIEKKHVMTAVILRDMRSRFFNHGLGFLIVSLWPLAHMIILIGLYTAMGRKAALATVCIYSSQPASFRHWPIPMRASCPYR